MADVGVNRITLPGGKVPHGGWRHPRLTNLAFTGGCCAGDLFF
jgi:hypothetical protein